METLFGTDYVKKDICIAFADNVVLNNSDIREESLVLREVLCEEERLCFGACVASSVKVQIIGVMAPSKGNVFDLSISVANHADVFRIGRYKVHSDIPTANRRYRNITAYDAMHDILVADVAAWYNTILPDDASEVTLREFRTSFLTYLGIEQEEITLVNDDMVIMRTVAPVQLSGKSVITAICEINGCFGHIGRNGKFQYIHLKEMKEGLYPSNTLYPRDDLYPMNPTNAEQISKSYYTSAKYEDYTTARINKLQIRQEEGDIGCIYGDGDNCYIVQDNFLLYGKATKELEQIAANMYSVISRVWYRPAHVEAKGNPCLEVGDGIVLGTKYETVYTYILQRTLKGIQALKDTYDAEGEQYQTEDVNSVHTQIVQLKGKSNVLERTIEETRLTIADIENGLQAQITMNANSIATEVTRAKNAENSLSSRITQTAESLRLEVTERTSMYNEEINTLQGGMDGNINLSFFDASKGDDGLTDAKVVEDMYGKQCINTGYSLTQSISIPAGTYNFSYEWLRNDPLFIKAYVTVYDVTDGELNYIYDKSLGMAWPDPQDEWVPESFQFKLGRTSRIMLDIKFLPPGEYPERKNSLYLTNIALHGTAQSVSDAIADVKAQILMQSDAIALKVNADDVVSAINLSPANIVISSKKIDLKGLVESDEFVTKYATMAALNVTNGIVANKADLVTVNALSGRIDTLGVQKLDAVKFTAKEISALGITVKAANVTGKLTAAQVDVDDVIHSNTFRGAAITVQALYALAGITVNGTACSWKTVQVINSSGNVVTIKYLGA